MEKLTWPVLVVAALALIEHRFRSRTRGANESMHESNEVYDTTGGGS